MGSALVFRKTRKVERLKSQGGISASAAVAIESRIRGVEETIGPEWF